jgi:hypothetical protein
LSGSGGPISSTHATHGDKSSRNDLVTAAAVPPPPASVCAAPVIDGVAVIDLVTPSLATARCNIRTEQVMQ